MGNFLHNLDGKQKIAALSIFIIAILTILGLTININGKLLINVSITIILILVITLLVLFNKTKNTIRYFSLSIILGTVIIVTTQKSLIQQLFDAFLSSYFPNYAEKSNLIEALPYLTQISVMIFVLVGVLIVNYFMRDNTAMGQLKKPIDEIVPESSIKEQIQRVISALNDDLRSIDIKTNWSIHNFVPLDAEVEVSTGNRKQKKITNLLNAIQKSDDRLFLVLGDPGSGKSVSLRKLTRELAEESTRTGKIPIYINLKEWHIEEDRKPTVEDIKDFVLQNILNRDIVITKFFDSYFDRLYEEGRLYFIFDSFDEIPMLLNESENSELIQHYSEIFFKFLKGSRAEISQGVLASRIFRKPTRDFQVNTILEIRPFDDEKIISMFKNLGIFNKELQIKLFKDRHDLVPVARNPFTAQLIADFTDKNNDRLPTNQAKMYNSYIISTLKSCNDKIERANLTVESIFETSMEIAQLMFDEHGFEISKLKLVEHFDKEKIEHVINILQFARLGRVGNDASKFSFVHRRFAEYFIVEKMILDEDTHIDYKSIPEDSKWRDALVLYCEVASFEKVQEIANFCWQTIETINNPKDVRVIHTVRFLRDAFKSRKDCLIDFEEDLAKYIYKQINEDNETIQIKLAVESVGLLKLEYMDKIIVKALQLRNYWISDTALKSCRHLQKVSDDLIIGLKQYIWYMPFQILFRNRRDIDFSFNLSSAFKNNSIYLTEKFYLQLSIVLYATIFIVIFLLILLTEITIKDSVSILLLFLTTLIIAKQIFEPNTRLETLKDIVGNNIKTDKDIKNDTSRRNRVLFISLAQFHLFAIVIAIVDSYKNFINTDTKIQKLLEVSEQSNLIPTYLTFSTIFILIFMYILLLNKNVSKTLFQSFITNVKDLFKQLISIIRALILVLLIASTAIPTYFITKYLIEKNTIFLLFIKEIFIWVKEYIFIFLIIPIIFIIYYLKIIITDWFLIKKAYKDNLSSRKTIEYYYVKLNNDFMKIKLLDYINANYDVVKEEWNDKNILKVSSKKSDILLAQLEEKWRGIEK